MSVLRPCEVDGCDGYGLGRVCGGCRTRFETALRSIPTDPERVDRAGDPIPGLDAELEVTRTRQNRTAPEGPVVSASPTRPLPWNDRADEASAALWAALAGWYRLIAPELPDPPGCGCPRLPFGWPWCWEARVRRWEIKRVLADRVPDPVTTTRLAVWLLGHVEDVMRHPDASFVVSDVLDATTGAERAVDAPPALVYAGTCDYCGADLYGRLGKASVLCVGRRGGPNPIEGCGTSYSVAARREQLLESLREHTATATEIAHGLSEIARVKIDRQKLYVWATRVIDTALVPDIGPSLPARSEHARPKLPDRRTREDFEAGRDRLFGIGEVLDLIAASAVVHQTTTTRRRENEPVPIADDWARRMVEGEPIGADRAS